MCSCNNEYRPNANSDFDFLERLASLEFKFGLHASMFQPIDGPPWGSNIGREPNVSDEELICSARKHRGAQRVENGPSQKR
ncbi:MAG: hypothetical protein DME72_01135 [Verrucomicrobia bacterium]|nr:MAG: hypothetical protein DME72_01135 [Verrucomicrobiota bacterium]